MKEVQPMGIGRQDAERERRGRRAGEARIGLDRGSGFQRDSANRKQHKKQSPSALAQVLYPQAAVKAIGGLGKNKFSRPPAPGGKNFLKN